MYILNKNDKKPLYVQLYEQLKKDIFHPTLKKSDDTPATNLEVANHYIKQNKSLKEQNKVLESKVITLENKIVSSSPQNDLLIKEIKDLKEKVTVLENENKSLKQKIKDIVSLANEKIKSLFQFKIWNNYKHKQTKFDLEYINENKADFWQELAHYHPKIETLYSENIKNELLKIDDLIPGEKETPNYSKMNLQDILNSNKEDLKEFTRYRETFEKLRIKKAEGKLPIHGYLIQRALFTFSSNDNNSEPYFYLTEHNKKKRYTIF